MTFGGRPGANPAMKGVHPVERRAGLPPRSGSGQGSLICGNGALQARSANALPLSTRAVFGARGAGGGWGQVVLVRQFGKCFSVGSYLGEAGLDDYR